MLNSSTLVEASVTVGSAALAAKVRKHNSNDAKCSELGWSYSRDLMIVGVQKACTLPRLATRLATRGSKS